MATNRRLPFLLCCLASLLVVQQLLAWWELRSSELRDARDRSHIVEVAQHGELAEREAVRSGESWIGELHGATGQPTEDVRGHPSDRLTPTTQSIAGTIDFEEESLSVVFELHECHPGSSLCSSGGVITVSAGDRQMCVISVGILQPPEAGVPHSHYHISWQPREAGLPLSDPERLKMLHRLAGRSEIPDHVSFHRLLRVAYGYEPQDVAPAPSESIEKQIVRAVFRAIVHARASTTSLPYPPRGE